MSFEVEHKYVPGFGPLAPKILILLESPTWEDHTSGKLFSRAFETKNLLKEAGINWQECWITSVSKYFVPPNSGKKKIPFHVRAKQYGIDMDEQMVALRNEINSMEPNLILGLGKTALWACTGKFDIGSYRGSIMHGMGRKFVGTFNPEHLSWQAADVEFRGYLWRQIMKFDFNRALVQSRFPDIKTPSRLLQIATGTFEMQEFKSRYFSSSKKMSVDIESNATGMPVCVGLACVKHHGLTIPLWNEGGISTIATPMLVQMWLFLSQMLMEIDVVGANFNYDRDKLKRLGFTIRRLVDDIFLKSMALNPELLKGLGFNTSIFTEEPFYKNEGMYEGSIKDLLLGCARDACVTIEVNAAMDIDLDEINQREFYENFLMKLPDMYWDIEQQGFKVDTEIRDQLLRKYIEWDEKCRHELFTLVGAEINVGSPKQVSILLFDNFKLPPKNGTGEEEITALLNSPTAVKKDEHRRVLELILEDRRVRKSISTYLMAMPDFDGRMRTTYFLGLDTGRTSTGQQDPPQRPTVEVIDENGKKKNKVLGIAFQTMTKHGDIGSDIRGMYVPDSVVYTPTELEYREHCKNNGIELEEDYEVFVQADSSQAEARVVWLLANDEEALKLVDEIDYHALTATWFFGGTESDYSKKVLGYEHPIRFAGKTLRHAGHLGAGKKRAAISVNTDARKYKIPILITEQIADRALKIFHSKQPAIQQVFQQSVAELVKETRTLIAPVPYGVNAKYGGRRTFFERFGDELLRQAFSYIPQRAVSDNTKAAGLRIRNRIAGIKIVMESHDALLFSIRKSKLTEYCVIIREEMERPIDFTNCSIPRRPLSIPCDIEVGMNYRDFKKFKDLPLIAKPPVIPKMIPRNIQEEFEVVEIPEDSRLTDIIYQDQMRKERDKLD